MRLITILGLALIFIAFLGLIKVYSEPIAAIYTESGLVEVLPPKPSIYSILGLEVGRGVRLRLPNSTVVNIVGSGEVPLRIDSTELRILFDSRGRFLALSTEGGNITISNVEVNQEFTKAVLTYTVAPFVSGLAFTTASLLISRRGGRRR